ncbi:MAG TPA: HAMP domain-containing sensor histidine kinase [Gemmatimonadaceae bacterium]|nr:HAMP domain-containing sensor histidine kinase [Gemmatimonadaceae bacterium]
MYLSTRAVRLRASSIALSLALIFALAGLYAVDRSLSTSNRAQVQVEAAESAALVGGFLAVHTEALQSIRGLYLDTTRVVHGEQFESLVSSMTQYANSFRRIWITDTAGRVREQHLFGPASPPLAEGLDIDTISALGVGRLAAAARATHRGQVTTAGSMVTGERGVLMLEPIYVGNSFRGFAGGSVTTDAILSSVSQARPRVRGQLVILANDDTIGATPRLLSRSASADTASSTLPVPGGGEWRVVVMRRSSYANVRPLVWGIGLATLGALIVMLLHERRQGIRLSERSAELERLSAELLRANRSKSEFLANVSHELRTPLNAIVGFVELLRDGVYGELAQRQISPVERIASSAGHLRLLVDQILDLAKMAAGRLEVHRESIDLRAFVLTVASEVEPLIAERGLDFQIAVSATLPRVRTDPMHLRQILMNLLSNATKFTPSGGITIRARHLEPPPPNVSHGAVTRPLIYVASQLAAAPPPAPAPFGPPANIEGSRPPGGWIALDVSDSGIGIAPNERERIFGEFEQVNAGPRGDSIHRGTGLGLAISRRLARLLGGDISIESELGHGATFTVWIPVEHEPARAAPQGDAPADAGSPARTTSAG